jgi:hypothetical protein
MAGSAPLCALTSIALKFDAATGLCNPRSGGAVVCPGLGRSTVSHGACILFRSAGGVVRGSRSDTAFYGHEAIEAATRVWREASATVKMEAQV